MLAVGLTGGIGSGKSTVAALLVARGAVLVDADLVAREVVAPGGPAYQAVIDRFGRRAIGPDGTVDRPRLAALVFGDPVALADLNAITHPAIGATMIERRDRFQGTDRIVVLDIPLLREAHRHLLDLAAVIVVDTPADLALERLTSRRGMDRTDAEARMAAQMGREERCSVADIVIDNSGDEAQLIGEVDRVWAELVRLGAVPKQ